MHVKKGDKVYIRTGKDRGLTGEILEVDRSKGRVKVHRRNMVKKHRRPNPLTGTEGARVDQENWIHASNVSLYSEQLEGPVRTQMRWVGKGGELFSDRREAVGTYGDEAPSRLQKVRVAAKTGEVFDEIKAG